MPSDQTYREIKQEKPAIVPNRTNGQALIKTAESVKAHSAFVFLIAMKYEKDEDRAKRACIDILKQFIRSKDPVVITDLKAELYRYTKSYFEDKHAGS
jgi:hypothetical protein